MTYIVIIWTTNTLHTKPIIMITKYMISHTFQNFSTEKFSFYSLVGEHGGVSSNKIEQIWEDEWLIQPAMEWLSAILATYILQS